MRRPQASVSQVAPELSVNANVLSRWRRESVVYENRCLATIERQVLRIVREDDLPGSEAPAAWLTYLRGGPANNLRRVAAHNHQDVVSLERLMLHLHDC